MSAASKRWMTSATDPYASMLFFRSMRSSIANIRRNT
jgi:hypothetical protein